MQDIKNELLKANPKIVCRQEEDDALLFNPESSAIKILNRTGYEIWKLCAKPIALEQIIEKIEKEYPQTSPDTIKENVVDFISLMKNLSFIEKIFK